MGQTKNQIDQLSLTFNNHVISQMNKVATCNRVQGVVIDESELASLEEMIKEAEGSSKGGKESPPLV